MKSCPGQIFRINDEHFYIAVPEGKISPMQLHCPICEKRDLWLVEDI